MLTRPRHFSQRRYQHTKSASESTVNQKCLLYTLSTIEVELIVARQNQNWQHAKCMHFVKMQLVSKYYTVVSYKAVIRLYIKKQLYISQSVGLGLDARYKD